MRRRAVKQIAHDGPADDDPRPGSRPLQDAHQPEMLDARGKGATERGKSEQGQRDQHHATTPERVGNRAVPQGHGGEGKKVEGERLLHFQRRRLQRFADVMEGRQVGVNGKRA